MTTVATDGRTMAADSLTTDSRQRVALGDKVHRLPDGSLVGCSGSVTAIRPFVRWMAEQKGEQPKLDDDFSALVLRPDGRIEWIDHKWEPVEYLAPAAIGSGADIALGAMLAGKKPKKAVAIAIQRDTCSGGPVKEMSI